MEKGGVFNAGFFYLSGQLSGRLYGKLQRFHRRYFKSGRRDGRTNVEYTDKRIIGVYDFWSKLLMNISKASGVDYVDLKKMDVFEFFTIVKNIEKKNE